jgi:membrane-associated protease RseP (regulator of RpoE activity)
VHPSSGSDSPSPALPDLPPFDPNDHYEQFTPKALPPPHGRLWVQLLLFGLTLITTTWAGAEHYAFFSVDMSLLDDPAALQQRVASLIADRSFYFQGLWYSLTILTILGCHEMGHYVACLRYGVTATRPYFLPVPLPITGTFGAFIRIKSRIPSRKALFDIGIAGPLAGFVIAVPALVVGLMMSRLDHLPADPSGLVELGEPLLFKIAVWFVWGDIPAGQSVNMHPIAFAAWFGLLATALNLFPISQLDGGHIAYAVLGRRSTVVTIVMLGVAIGLAFNSRSWIVWTVLLTIMIAMLGPHHPPTLYDDEPVSGGRIVLAAVALIILILCFTPVPIGDILTGRSG